MLRKLIPLFLIVSSGCLAVTAPSDASLRELLQVTQVHKLVDGMIPQIDQMMKASMAQSLGGRKLTVQQQRIVDGMEQKMMAIVRGELSWSHLEPMYLRIYRESLTQSEVDGMVAFYKTPAGAAVVTKMPVVMQKTMVAMQQMMGPMMQQVQSVIQETAAEMKAASMSEHGAEPAAAAPGSQGHAPERNAPSGT